MNRRQFLASSVAGISEISLPGESAARSVVLTFDDAVKSHRTFVAPLLKELGFGATFFVTHRWMDDSANFMTWEDIAEIHRLGFEIGNHSWTHAGFNTPRTAAKLAGELALVENALESVKVPRPVSFAWCANAFGPEAVEVLRERGYRIARRGMQPEVKYGESVPGPLFDPKRHHPLLIPTSGDAYPGWTLEHFKRVVDRPAKDGIVVLQFHGVPDVAHPWVHTPPERFREYMDHLKSRGYRVIALRDLLTRLPERTPRDPILKVRHPRPDGLLPESAEKEATLGALDYWLRNILEDHRFSDAEAARTIGSTPRAIREHARRINVRKGPARDDRSTTITVVPYPGGRHPRIGFLDGAINPMRGTKASVFLPWDSASYVVVDLPEAIFSNLGLLFLAHTHIPTIWERENRWIENVDWKRAGEALKSTWSLPNGIGFGASIRPVGEQVEMELWLRNGTDRALTGLRTQVCNLLGRAKGFEAQTGANKIIVGNAAAVHSTDKTRWILTAWGRAGRAWQNPPCPCIHSDPVLPDCPPGETVRVRGVLRFYDGGEGEKELARLSESLKPE